MPGLFWIGIIFMCTFAMLKLDAFSCETKLCETFATTAKISFVLELPTGHLKVIKSVFILGFGVGFFFDTSCPSITVSFKQSQRVVKWLLLEKDEALQPGNTCADLLLRGYSRQASVSPFQNLPLHHPAAAASAAVAAHTLYTALGVFLRCVAVPVLSSAAGLQARGSKRSQVGAGQERELCNDLAKQRCQPS